MRPQRLLDELPYETWWVVGNEHGMVTLHRDFAGFDVIAVHSPVPVRDWAYHDVCERMERPCWFESNWSGAEESLDQVMAAVCAQAGAAGGTEEIWRLLEQAHGLYLEGRQ